MKRVIALLLLGLLGWALCGAIMFIGMSVLDIKTTLIIHAIGAPLIFFLIGRLYFHRFRDASPFGTAIWFLLIVVFMDFFLVALVINRSLEMFRNALGTWIPFALIFLSTYLAGFAVRKGR